MLTLAGMETRLEGFLSGHTSVPVALAGQTLGSLSKTVHKLALNTPRVPHSSIPGLLARPPTASVSNTTETVTPPSTKRIKVLDVMASLLPSAALLEVLAASRALVIEPDRESVAKPALRTAPISAAMRMTIAAAAALSKKQAEGLTTMVVARRVLNPRYRKILGWSATTKDIFPSPNVR